MMKPLSAALVAGALAIVVFAARRPHAPPQETPAAAVKVSSAHAPAAVGEARTHWPTTPAAPIARSGGPRPSPEAPPTDALRAVRAAAHDPGNEATATLTRALDDPDEVARLEAIDALVARGHAPTLGRLLKMDPAADPWLAPTVIAGVGELGHRATDPASRRAALERLLHLLASEKERNGTDSAGNVVAIVEALAVLQHPDAAAPLERELADDYHDVAGKTAIVQALGKIGQRSSVPALARLRVSVAPEGTDDDYVRDLKRELVAAIDEVSGSLRAN